MLFSVEPMRCLIRKQLRFAVLCALVFATGCRSHAPHALPVALVRATTVVPSAVEQVQSSALYQQARADCKRHDYLAAANHLQTLAQTPGLAPEAITFVQKQRSLCLKDAGQPGTAPIIASPPVRTPADADCGPRALLIVCQKLGVKTNLDALRKTAGTTADGTTLEGLQKAAQKLGLKAEGVQVSREALPDVSPPVILWVRRNHFCLLTGISGRGDEAKCSVEDPNKPGEEVWLQEKLLQQSSGVLLLLHR